MHAKPCLFAFLFFVFCISSFFSSLALAQNETEKELKERIEELEIENQKLRRTIEEQVELILEIRNEKKQTETASSIQKKEGSKKGQNVFDDERWHGSIGVINFGLIDSYDHLLNTYDADYDVSGDLYGGRFSIFKGRNGVGGSVYLGQYEFTSGGDSDKRQIEQISDRIDIDLAWMYVRERDERFQFGTLFGAKWLNAEKELTIRELTAEETFDSETKWYMGTGGVFLSYRLMKHYPFFVTGSFNVLLGYVEGTVEDREDNTADGDINHTYKDDSMTAYGGNGTLGFQYILLKHIAIGVGYRGQILNSTDGFMNLNASFYDGHQSVFAALDVAF